MVTLIKRGRVISGGGIHEADVYIRGGVIERVVPRSGADDAGAGAGRGQGVDCVPDADQVTGTDRSGPADHIIDATGLYVSAGFIDLHLHGGGGYDVMDGGVEPIVNAARLHMRHGTTTLYPTAVCASMERTERFLSDAAQAQKVRDDMPHLPGVHMEGPYMSKAQCGALDTQYIVPFDPPAYRRLTELANGLIKRWSFAPELEGAEAFLSFAHEHGIVTSIAHSDGVYVDVERAYLSGCRLMTHFYSGMSLLTREKGYRRLGVVESGYLLDGMTVEVICDGKHLPPELLRLIYKMKGVERMCLVTDAMRVAGTDRTGEVSGLADGRTVIVEDGVAKTADREAFAGSIATADRLVRTAHEAMGASLPEAVRMMTEIPARIMGLDKKGAVREGYDADLVLFDEHIDIKRVLVCRDA